MQPVGRRQSLIFEGFCTITSAAFSAHTRMSCRYRPKWKVSTSKPRMSAGPYFTGSDCSLVRKRSFWFWSLHPHHLAPLCTVLSGRRTVPLTNRSAYGYSCPSARCHRWHESSIEIRAERSVACRAQLAFHENTDPASAWLRKAVSRMRLAPCSTHERRRVYPRFIIRIITSILT